MPTNTAEWANWISAYSASKSVQLIEKEIADKQVSDITRDAVAIFVDRTSTTNTVATSEARMIEAVKLAKLARVLAEKEDEK